MLQVTSKIEPGLSPRQPFSASNVHVSWPQLDEPAQTIERPRADADSARRGRTDQNTIQSLPQMFMRKSRRKAVT